MIIWIVELLSEVVFVNFIVKKVRNMLILFIFFFNYRLF